MRSYEMQIRIQQDILDDFEQIVHNQNLNPGDFHLVQNDRTNYQGGQAVPLNFEVTVRNNRTDISRTYQSGNNTDWLREFKQDLTNGIFG